MKKIFNIPLILLSIITYLLISGCEKGPQYEKYTYPAQTASGISPNIGFPGSYVTITGKNFDTLAAAVKVWFGGVLADSVISSNGTQIVVKVPTNAVSGKISLQVWTTRQDSIGTFTILPSPSLTSVISEGSIAPIIAYTGDTVLLRGQNFLTDPTKVSVSFNSTPVTNIVSLQDTLIKVIAPAGYTTGNVSITFMGIFTLTGTALSPTLPEGNISSLYLKNYQQPFTSNSMTSAQKGTAGKWGTPDYWTVNSAGQNQLNTSATQRSGGLSYGNFSTGELILQSGWGDAIGNTLVNAKVYQTISLPAGNYSFVANINNFSFKSGSANYIVAAESDSLPDINDVSAKSLSYTNFSAVSSSNNATMTTLNFTLAKYTTISLGFVSTQLANSWFRVASVQLNLLK